MYRRAGGHVEMLLGSGPFPGAVFVLPAGVLGVGVGVGVGVAVAVAVAVDCSAAAAVGVLAAAAAAAAGTPDNAESVFRTDVRSGSISVQSEYDLSVWMDSVQCM